jgi:hypothetical protein
MLSASRAGPNGVAGVTSAAEIGSDVVLFIAAMIKGANERKTSGK